MANLFRKLIKFKAVVESSPVVGSSKKIIDGFISNYNPIEVLFFYPPDTPLILLSPTYVSLHLVSPKNSITLFTITIFYSSLLWLNLMSAINLKASNGVNVGNM